MAIQQRSFLKSYRFSIILLGSMVIGGLLGYLSHDAARAIKPLGSLFLRSLFMIIVPMIYFSVASAVSAMSSTMRLVRILGCMLVVFTITGIVAATIMTTAVQIFPPAIGFVASEITQFAPQQEFGTVEKVLRAFTTDDFVELLSKQHTLALIVFAVLTGIAASAAGEKAKPFTAFLAAGNAVFMKVIGYIMYLAPIGLGAYSANLIVDFGGKLVESYGRAMLLYYPLTFVYFFVAFTIYVFVAGGRTGLKRFWEKIWPPSLTALATGSSYVTIPVNLEAAAQMGVPKDIRETVIPLGATLHMEGSCLAAVLKIAFVCGVYHIDMSSPEMMAKIAGVSLLAGMVISGIPGGGVTGEVLIMALFGFRPEAFFLMNTIGQLVDPPATMVNAIGDNVSSMLVARLMHGKNWMDNSIGAAAAPLTAMRVQPSPEPAESLN